MELPPLPPEPPADAPYETTLAFASLSLRRASTEAELAATTDNTAAVKDASAATREHVSMGQALMEPLPAHEVWLKAYLQEIRREPYDRERAVGRAHAAVQDYQAAFPNAAPAASIPVQAA